MSKNSFESSDQLKTFISESSPDQFKNQLSHFSFSDLAESFVLLQSQPALESKSKLNFLFEFIDSPTTLEMIGQRFSVSHFLSFLDCLDRHSSYQNRLNFILVGLQPLVFSHALQFVQQHHLVYLKSEGLLEPLQYHLTQFAHEGEFLQQQIEQKSQQFIQGLASIEQEELTQEGFNSLIEQIDVLRDNLLNYLERISVALAIVWHTDRIDLIEKLSSINEALQHQLIHLIGHTSFNHHPATGLYLLLTQILAQIFDTELKDEDSALEGLTRLSIWHLKDYWELGLLPFIPQLKKLDLNAQEFSEEERTAHRQHLFSLVQEQLERLQIGTVGNLKKTQLFSKPLLKRYIDQHRHLLINQDRHQ